MQLSRVLTFLFGCILLRIIIAVLVYLAGNLKDKFWLTAMGWIGLIIAISFLFLFFSGGNDLADKQLEIWEDDKQLWWKQLRLFHGLMYLLFFISAVLYQSPQSYIFLLIDVIFGLFFWILHNLKLY